MMAWFPGTGSAAEPDYWAGSHLGGYLGYGADKSVVLDYGSNPTDSLGISGYMVGLLGGHDWTWGNLVAGLEAEAGYAYVKGEAPCTNPAWTCTARLDVLATLRARVGLAYQRVLIYGMLGPAVGRVEARTISPSGAEYPGRERRRGWTLGVGGELAINQQLHARVELAHMDLGRHDYVVDPGNIVTLDTKVTSFRVGADWKF